MTEGIGCKFLNTFLTIVLHSWLITTKFYKKEISFKINTHCLSVVFGTTFAWWWPSRSKHVAMFCNDRLFLYNKNSCVWLGCLKVTDLFNFINICFLIASHMSSLDSNPRNSSLIHLISKCNHCSTYTFLRTVGKKINALKMLITKAGHVFLVWDTMLIICTSWTISWHAHYHFVLIYGMKNKHKINKLGVYVMPCI